MKNILITGGAGFIGSNFIPLFLEKNQNVNVINLDALTYASDIDNLKDCHSSSRYSFIEGDIRDKNLIKSIFSKYDISGVIHFAAESHVDNSIDSPDIFIETNINGTFNLLHNAYLHWMDGPFNLKENHNHSKFLHVSTDEVYGSLGETGLFSESTPYAPNSPYSASKASSDMLVRSYRETYGMQTLITNCSNNYGPKQHKEKLIPKIIHNAINGEQIPIYGDGKNVRDWLFVLDHCNGIDLVFKKGEYGQVYNIGGKNEMTNINIVQTICKILDQKLPKEKSYSELITFVEDRAGHDRRYAIDASKIEEKIGWKAQENFSSGINLTIDWYLNKLSKKTKI